MGRGKRREGAGRVGVALSDAGPLTHVLPDALKPLPPIHLEVLSMTKLGQRPERELVCGTRVTAKTTRLYEEDEMVELSDPSGRFEQAVGFAGEGWQEAKRGLRSGGLEGRVVEVDGEDSRIVVAIARVRE